MNAFTSAIYVGGLGASKSLRISPAFSTGASPWILQLVSEERRQLAFRHRSQVGGERHALWGNGCLKLSIQLACTLRGHDEHMNISRCKLTRPHSIGASYICTSLPVLEGPAILSKVERSNWNPLPFLVQPTAQMLTIFCHHIRKEYAAPHLLKQRKNQVPLIPVRGR